MDEDPEKLKEHPAYQAGVADAHAGVAPNPFNTPSKIGSLDAAAPGGAIATLPRTPSAAGPASAGGRGYNEIVSPVVTPSNRSGIGTDATRRPVNYADYPAPGTEARTTATDVKPRGVSQADFDNRRGGPNDPWANGIFKSPQSRLADMANQTGAYAAPTARGVLATLPRTPQVPVGGQVAVIDNDTGVNGNTRTRTISTPFGSGFVTNSPVAAGTRQPVIAGADGQNVAADFVAGGRFSSAKAGTDPTLDPNYVAGLPRRRKQVAYAPATRRLF